MRINYFYVMFFAFLPSITYSASIGEKDKLLIHVVRFGLVSDVVEAISNGADINSIHHFRDPWFKGTSLNMASKLGRTSIVKILLAKKADIDAKDDNQWTSLHIAAMNGHIDVVNLLISEKASIDSEAHIESTPLHWAASNGRTEVIKALISSKANINAKDNCNQTPLHWAALCGQVDASNTLILAKASIDAFDNFNSTPLYLAAENGHNNVIKLLTLFKADVNAIGGQYNCTPLDKAAKNGHINAVDALISAKATINESQLISAITSGHIETVKLLLEYHPIFNLQTHKENTEEVLIEWWHRSSIKETIKNFINNRKMVLKIIPKLLVEQYRLSAPLARLIMQYVYDISDAQLLTLESNKENPNRCIMQ